MTLPKDAAKTVRPTAATTVVAVIGDPIAHSLSPVIYNAAFAELGLDWICVGSRVPAGQVDAALAGMRALGFAGLSVTMPHKEAAARLMDRLSASATRLAAVNCVVRRGAELVGDNTDGAGFVAALHRGTGFDPRGARCAVVGAGGAARAVVLALAEAGAVDIAVVNRTPERAATAAALAGSVGRVGGPTDALRADLVVNATPVGMADTAAAAAPSLVDPRRLSAGQVAADLVYHPLITPWLEAASHAGATPLGGLGMLIHQAAIQLTSWTGAEAPLSAMWHAAAAAVASDAAGREKDWGEE